jgi:hypothetical protein
MSNAASNLPQIPAGGTSLLIASSVAGGPSASVAPPTFTADSSNTMKKVTAKKATGPAATKAKAPKKTAAPRVKKPSASSTYGKKTSGGATGANSAANLAALNTDSIMMDAAIARLDLAKQRSIAVQRKSDPMWYRIEDVVLSHTVEDSSMFNNNILPEQVTIVERALSNVGGLNRSDVTPQAMVCLLEQARSRLRACRGSVRCYASGFDFGTRITLRCLDFVERHDAIAEIEFDGTTSESRAVASDSNAMLYRSRAPAQGTSIDGAYI